MWTLMGAELFHKVSQSVHRLQGAQCVQGIQKVLTVSVVQSVSVQSVQTILPLGGNE